MIEYKECEFIGNFSSYMAHISLKLDFFTGPKKINSRPWLTLVDPEASETCATAEADDGADGAVEAAESRGPGLIYPLEV